MDAVITYVDCNKDFEELYKKYVNKEFSLSRFRSYHVLDLQIKLIRKYMPYIKNIFVVVYDKSQVKEYSDLSGAIIIEHSQIIPSQYLPCFNSCTIEMFLHNIPNLAEQFIYFNDDTFVINKISQLEFFKGAQPVLNPKIKNIPENPNLFEQQCINSTNEILKKLKKEKSYSGKYFSHEHICRPYLKRTFSILWSRYREDIIYSLTRTRNRKNYNCYLFNNYDIISDNYVEKKHDYLYIDLLDSPTKLKNKIGLCDKSLICINDNGEYYDFSELSIKIKEALLWHLNKDKESKYIEEKEPEKPKLIFNNSPLKVALCAIAKNENLYIREWVEWYKNLGITKIFLYDNNEFDGERFEDVINDYIESGFVKVINKRGVEKGRFYDAEGINLQPKCYIEFYEGEGKNYDWICFFDVDEFLNFKNGLNLFSFLNKDTFNDTDTILVSWEHYDDNNLYDYDKRPVVKRFTKKSKIGFHGVKSIVRPNRKIENKAQENLIHCFKLVNHKIKFSNGAIAPEINSHNFYKLSNDVHDKCDVVLNHYKTKTITEYLYRHLGRYWGTGKKYTDNAKTLENCYKDFFLYNIKTEVKENIINTFVKNDKIIEYYKKINSLNIDNIINKYNNYIASLDVKENLICKKYNKEIGIISLTTWKARINSVYITLCNLLDICPEFHLVLVLSIEEFPNKEYDLPVSLRKLISNKLIEVLWTPNNYKTCKKLIFTIEKYSSKKVPIITADDDCFYITNYAKELYDKYKENNNYILRYNMYNVKETWQYSQGPCTLYNPITFKYFLKNKSKFLEPSMAYKDDQVITKICKDNKIKITYLYRGHIFPFVFINEHEATNDNTKNIDFINCYV